MPRKAKDKDNEIKETKEEKKATTTKKTTAKKDAAKVTEKATTQKAASSTKSSKKTSTEPKSEVKSKAKTAVKSSTKKAESKTAKTKKASVKKTEPKSDETKKVAAKKAEPKSTKTKKVSTKKAETKATETKKASTKKAEPKATETKKASTKKAEPKSTETKKASTKKAAPKATKTKSTKKADTVSTKTAAKTTRKKSTTTSTSTKRTRAKKAANLEILEYYDLPYKYGNTLVKLLAQTPKTLFVYWEISNLDIKNYQEQFGENFLNITKPILIVHNITLNKTYEVEINDFANCWYLNIDDSDCKFDIELARKFLQAPLKSSSKSNDYIYIAKSNDLTSPNDHILFEKLTNTITFKNVKTNETIIKDIKSFKFLTDIYNFYKDMYKDELLKNPSSNFII